MYNINGYCTYYLLTDTRRSCHISFNIAGRAEISWATSVETDVLFQPTTRRLCLVGVLVSRINLCLYYILSLSINVYVQLQNNIRNEWPFYTFCRYQGNTPFLSIKYKGRVNATDNRFICQFSRSAGISVKNDFHCKTWKSWLTSRREG